jgi:hypothetical protein
MLPLDSYTKDLVGDHATAKCAVRHTVPTVTGDNEGTFFLPRISANEG